MNSKRDASCFRKQAKDKMNKWRVDNGLEPMNREEYLFFKSGFNMAWKARKLGKAKCKYHRLLRSKTGRNT